MFDEQPDGDPHGECAAHIKNLEVEIRWCADDMAKWFMSGDRPDEFKLREWIYRLGDAVGDPRRC